MNEIENDGSRSPTNAPQRAGFLEFRILIRILGFIKAVAETKLPTFDQTPAADPLGAVFSQCRSVWIRVIGGRAVGKHRP